MFLAGRSSAFFGLVVLRRAILPFCIVLMTKEKGKQERVQMCMWQPD